MIKELQNLIRDEESKTDKEIAKTSKKIDKLEKELSSLGFFRSKKRKQYAEKYPSVKRHYRIKRMT